MRFRQHSGGGATDAQFLIRSDKKSIIFIYVEERDRMVIIYVSLEILLYGKL